MTADTDCRRPIQAASAHGNASPCHAMNPGQFRTSHLTAESRRCRSQGRGRAGDAVNRGQLDRPAFAVGLIDCLEECDDPAAVFAGNERRPIFDDRAEEVVDLQGVVVVRRVDRFGIGRDRRPGSRASRSSSPGIVHKSLSGGSEMADTPAMKVAPRSVSTPTDAPVDPWMCTLV